MSISSTGPDVAANSLGLLDDDAVDFAVEIERTFGLKLADGAWGACNTLGDIHDMVIANAPPEWADGSKCPTMIAFNRLRAMFAADVPDVRLTPTTPLSALSAFPVRKLYERIKAGGLTPPPPILSFVGILGVALFLISPIAAKLLSEGWVAAIGMPAGFMLFALCPRRFPLTVQTFGDLSRACAAYSAGHLFAQGARSSSNEIWLALTTIAADHSMLPPHEMTRDTLLLLTSRRKAA